jgi:DNA repair exonuclease SbcCD nuclease subunit
VCNNQIIPQFVLLRDAAFSFPTLAASLNFHFSSERAIHLASSSKKQASPTKSAVLKELQELASKSNSSVTRNFYRENSQYSEADWQKFFPKFNDFLAAAGLGKVTLSPVEMELLKLALPTIQETKSETYEYPSVETLTRLLECSKDTAQNILKYVVSNDVAKIANSLEAQPVRAETKATVQYALGDTSGSLISHVLRENVRLQRRITKLKRKDETDKLDRTREVLEEIDDLKQHAKTVIKRPLLKNKPVKQTGLMLEVDLFDLHFGKNAWPNETGDRPYDVKITEAMFFRALERLIERSRGFEYEQVVFIVGNDLLHSNDLESRTANDTVVDSDGRFQKAFWTARKAMCAAIEMLKEIAPVKVIVCVGNHDRFSSWALGDSLECFFHNDPLVQVDNSPTLRKYCQWGEVGLLFVHGDLGNREDMPLLFATENPSLFGATKFREIHTGHNHSTRTQEFHGVRVRILSSLSTADEYHAAHGYVGNLRTAESFVWSKTEGLIAQFTYTDQAFEPIITKRVLANAL